MIPFITVYILPVLSWGTDKNYPYQCQVEEKKSINKPSRKRTITTHTSYIVVKKPHIDKLHTRLTPPNMLLILVYSKNSAMCTLFASLNIRQKVYKGEYNGKYQYL